MSETNTPSDILTQATQVLAANDRGNYTMPGQQLYPHQWLWDSCFIAIGLRHTDLDRAKTELLSLLRGQWKNGMLPNIIFRDEFQYRADRNAWRSWLNPYSPDTVVTSGITQPPMLAEAVVQIGKKLSLPERRTWYKTVWPALLAYHQWLYEERDPHNEGLVLQIHPWEVGLDNTPPWMQSLHEHQLPWWIRAIEVSHLEFLFKFVRRDTRTVPLDERFDTIEVLAMFDVQRRLKRKAYDTDKILNHSLFAIEDLTFNSILVRANEHLRNIAKSIRTEVPDELQQSMAKTVKAFDMLWDQYAEDYFSRDFITHRLLKTPSIAGLMPLYAGCISKERAHTLINKLESEHIFGTAWPIPSVPANASQFNARRYWQGPTWVNTNWLIIDGLRRYGYADHADALTESTLEMIQNGGCAEYFDPLTGEPLGADNFSWTAALAIDLLSLDKK